MARQSSFLWNYFDKLENEETKMAKCKKCGLEIIYKKHLDTIKNHLLNHFIENHFIESHFIEPQERKNQETQTTKQDFDDLMSQQSNSKNKFDQEALLPTDEQSQNQTHCQLPSTRDGIEDNTISIDSHNKVVCKQIRLVIMNLQPDLSQKRKETENALTGEEWETSMETYFLDQERPDFIVFQEDTIIKYTNGKLEEQKAEEICKFLQRIFQQVYECENTKENHLPWRNKAIASIEKFNGIIYSESEFKVTKVDLLQPTDDHQYCKVEEDRFAIVNVEFGNLKVLIVSFHGTGQRMTDEEKIEILIQYLKYFDEIKATNSCDAIVIGGDFNVPIKKIVNMSELFDLGLTTIEYPKLKPRDIDGIIYSKDFFEIVPDSLKVEIPNPGTKDSTTDKDNVLLTHPVFQITLKVQINLRDDDDGLFDPIGAIAMNETKLAGIKTEDETVPTSHDPNQFSRRQNPVQTTSTNSNLNPNQSENLATSTTPRQKEKTMTSRIDVGYGGAKPKKK